MSDNKEIADENSPAVTPDLSEKKPLGHDVQAVDPEKIQPGNPDFPIYAVLQSQRKGWYTAWGWLAATALFCAWTTSFTYAVFISDKPLPRAYDWSPSLTQQLVNIASHVVVLFTTGLISAVFEALSWSLASRPKKASRPEGTTLGTFLTVQKNTDLMGVGRLFMIPGPQLPWSIMRFIIAAGAWGVGVILLSHVTVERVYTPGIPFNVTAGLTDLHTSVVALERLNVIPNSTSTTSNSATLQDTGINMMITGATNSILTDPTFVVSVAPINCTSSHCKSLFLPGGMELVRYHNNGTAVDSLLDQEGGSVVVVNNAPGFQVEYEPSTYQFNYTTDCNMYGYAISSFFSCLKFDGAKLISGVVICPPSQAFAGTCLSDQAYIKNLDATISLGLYQRIATVSYDKTNFSIIDVRDIQNGTSTTSQALVADFQKMFQVMYPPLSNLETEVGDVIGSLDFSQIWPDLAYWSSVFCVQSEIAAAKWLEEHGFPTWAEGKQDLLEGLMTIPIQFGTMMWQFVDVNSLPISLSVTASFSTVTYRTRSPIWPIALFAGLAFALVLWAFICLLYVRFSGYATADGEKTQATKDAFKNGNLYDVDDRGFWEILWAFVCQPFGKKIETRAREKVVAKALPNDYLIAVDPKQGEV